MFRLGLVILVAVGGCRRRAPESADAGDQALPTVQQPRAFRARLIDLSAHFSLYLRQHLVGVGHRGRRVGPLKQPCKRLVDFSLQVADVLLKQSETRPHDLFDLPSQPNFTLLFHRGSSQSLKKIKSAGTKNEGLF